MDLNATLSPIGTLSATLSESVTLSVTLTPIPVLTGTFTPMQTLTGTLSKRESISGTLSAVGQLSGTLDLFESDYAPYVGAYTVTPRVDSATVLETKDRVMSDNVTVLEIPYFETSNTSGYTVYIGNEV